MDRRSVLGGGLTLGATALLAGCGGGGASEAPDPDANPDEVSGKVVHWTYPMGETDQDSWWKPLIDEFKQTYPKVEVQVVQQPWQGREQALTTAITGQSAPDVVYFNPDFVPKFAAEDLLFSLDSAMESEKDDFVPSSLAAYTHEGKLYGFPLLMTVSNPGYNVKLLEKLKLDEPPVTFDEIRDVAQTCVDNKLTWASYAAADGSLNHTYYPFLWTAGGTVLNEDQTKSAFNSEAGVTSLSLLRDLADMKALNPQALTQPSGKFEQGKFARGTELMGLTLGIPEAQKIMGEDAVKGSAPFHHTVDTVFGSVGALSIFNTTESPEAAVAWVKFVTGKETMKKFLRASTYLPPRLSLKDMWADNEDNSFKSQFVEQVNVGVLHPKSRELMDVLRTAIQGCLLGRSDPKATLEQAAADVDDLLARA